VCQLCVTRSRSGSCNAPHTPGVPGFAFYEEPLLAAGCGFADDLPLFAAFCIRKSLMFCTGVRIMAIRKPQVVGSIPIAGSIHSKG
jgi:hypothetical protein